MAKDESTMAIERLTAEIKADAKAKREAEKLAAEQNATRNQKVVQIYDGQAVFASRAQIERKERAKLIEQCLEELPEEERLILWMFYYQELSLKEIIDVTSYTQANLKVKLHRARKKLLNIVQYRLEPEMINHYGRK